MPRDPVRRPGAEAAAAEIADIDGTLVRLADDMVETMYEAPGLGLAAPQVGVEKRLFVYDIGDGPQTWSTPTIVESRRRVGLRRGLPLDPRPVVEIVRPKAVHLTGCDLDGNEVSIEADELLARLFQHELDHLDGVLLFERLDADSARRRCRSTAGAAAHAAGRRASGANAPRCRCSLPRRPATALAAAPPGRPGGSSSSARRRWPSRRCGRWSTAASTSPSWSRGADNRRGGGARLSPSPVKAAALELGLPVTASRRRRRSTPAADLGVVVAFGRLIKPHVLERCRW